ncbi:Endo-1,4-beta-xylanase A [bioreactor metagenome]|uniref:Endo-1,4-beta-xylanase A n=1 Tax=bioreactor metagenome TaxID=1076179 RepID=A0A644Y4N7_9ZZZZ|nr:sugar-binding protein [Paludibacter sp.]
MRRNLHILLVILFASLFLSATKPKVFICNYTDDFIIIDAKLKEWKNAKTITLRDITGESDNVLKIKTLWDNENLYFAFIVKDDDLEAKQHLIDHPELYLDDMIEFLLDAYNEKDSCWNQNKLIYHINLLGQKKDDRGNSECVSDWRWNGNAHYAISLKGTLNDSTDIDDGYIVEISISWDELGIRPSSGLKIGADFVCGDCDYKGNCFFDWVEANPFRSPYAFGDIVLIKHHNH